MKTTLAVMGTAVFLCAGAALAQAPETTLACKDGGRDGDRFRSCEVREQTMAAAPRLDVDASPNGGITVTQDRILEVQPRRPSGSTDPTQPVDLRSGAPRIASA